MSPVDAVVLFLILFLPLNWVVQRQLRRLKDPAYLRRHGVVVQRESALEAHSEPIGEYMGRPIWGTVTFKGMLYRFDHVIARRERERIRAGELFLEPGLVYVVI